MEFKGRSTDPFEQLITETLDEQLGSPPSVEVWKRIAEEISQPPPDLNQRGQIYLCLVPLPYGSQCVYCDLFAYVGRATTVPTMESARINTPSSGANKASLFTSTAPGA